MAAETTNESISESGLESLDKVYDLLIEKCELLVRRLRDFVEFPTVASDPSRKQDIQDMAEHLVEVLKKFGLKAILLPMTFEQVQTDNPTPPLVLAETKQDPSKRTVCFYGHFDVLPLTMQDYWYSDPFVLTSNNDGTLVYGKGSSLSKGPLLCLINAIGAYQQLRLDLPINVKIVMDPAGLTQDELTAKFLKKTNLEFFQNVDYVCMCLGHWLGLYKPCVCHGSRGLCHFTMQIEGASKDLHSGHYGGLLNEPMSDLVYMLNQLVDKKGIIKINDIYKDVVPATKEEIEYYKTIQFVVCDFKRELGARELLVNEDKKSLLMNMWRMPSLTIHGVEGAFSGPRNRNVIPSSVTGKFSINIVPNMTPSKVKKCVFAYLNKIWKARKSTNKIKVQMTIGKLAWFTDPKDINCVAAVNAVKRVYNEEPELVRDSKRVPMANALRRVTNASVIAIPVGKANDVTDNNAEKLDLTNYINGCKVFAAYFYELSTLSPKVQQQEKPPCNCKITGEPVDCNCYLKAGWMMEEEEEQHCEEEDEMSLVSCEGLSSTGFVPSNASSPTFQEPASKRYYSYSSRVKKMVNTLKVLIAEGNSIIVPSVSSIAQAEDVGDAFHGSDKTLEASKADVAPKKTGTSEKSIQSNIDGKLVKSSESKLSKDERSKEQVTPMNSSAMKIATSDLVKQNSNRGNSAKNIDVNIKPLEVSRSLKDGTTVDSEVNPTGYVGKKPFAVMDSVTKDLSNEPFDIISSLSALLYKRRAAKLTSASIKTLAGSRVIDSAILGGNTTSRIPSKTVSSTAYTSSKFDHLTILDKNRSRSQTPKIVRLQSPSEQMQSNIKK